MKVHKKVIFYHPAFAIEKYDNDIYKKCKGCFVPESVERKQHLYVERVSYASYSYFM